MLTTGVNGYHEGDKLPKEEVCMVNNIYMGIKQIEVPFEGKLYYASYEDCKERIPKEVRVRKAVDPFTGREIDKANSYIVLMNEKGRGVTYFENEKNYKEFIKSQSIEE